MTEDDAKRVKEYLEAVTEVHIRGDVTDKHASIAANAGAPFTLNHEPLFGFRTPCSIPLFILHKMEKELNLHVIITATCSEHGYVTNLLIW